MARKDNSRSAPYTIPKLAELLGVSAQAVRNWIESGRVQPPEKIPVTGERVYSAETAARIEREYMVRVAENGTRGPGAAGRREQARAFMRQQSDEEPEGCSPAEIVLDEVNRWLELADDLLPNVVLVSVVANMLPSNDPVWVMIVAPPSSGKTELIRAVEGIDGVHPLGKLTGRTFVSGMLGEDRSLLVWLSAFRKWLLTHKDWGTILSLSPTERNEVLGQLRQIYDGSFDARFGTGVSVTWRGKLGFLVGATPAVDRLQKWSSELGERFVQFRPTTPDSQRVTIRASLNKGREKEMREALSGAYLRAFQEVAQLALNDDVGKSPQGELVAGALGRLVALARSPVTRDRFGGGFEIAEPEGPARLTGVFTQIYRAAGIVYAGDDTAATRLVVRLGIDSITPGLRRKLIARLAGAANGLVVSGLGRVLGCDDNTVRRHLEDLVSLGLASSEKPLKTTIYHASRDLADRVAQVYLDEFEPREALQKLAGLYTHYIHEEKEEEEVGEGILTSPQEVGR